MEVLTCRKLFESLLIVVKVDVIIRREKCFFVPALLPSRTFSWCQGLCTTRGGVFYSSISVLILRKMHCAVVVKLLAIKDWEINMDVNMIYNKVVKLLHTKWPPDVLIVPNSKMIGCRKST